MTASPAPPGSPPDWERIAGRPPFAVAWDAVRQRIGGSTVLVTGAAGSLGAPLSHALASAAPRRLVLLDCHEGSLFHLRESIGTAEPDVSFRAVLTDVRAARRLERVFLEERPSIVFHLAAYKHVPWGEEDAEAFIEANILGAQAVIRAATAAGAARIVYPSTDKAIDPPSLYGATKRLVETMLYAAAARGGPACSVVRFVNVLGSRGSAPEKFARQLAEGKPLSVTDREMRRYWITPDHARLLLLHAACLPDRAITVAPDAGDEISVLEIARRMALALRPDDGEPQIAITGRRPGERLSEPLTAAHERVEPLPLPGILRVVGTYAPESERVDAAVRRLSDLLGAADAVSQKVLRDALFQEVTALQSPP